MNPLRAYLNVLSFDEQCAYAKRAGTTINYLRKALSTGQKFGGVIARGLDEASGGCVSKHVLRPDIFGESPAAASPAAASAPAASAEDGPELIRKRVRHGRLWRTVYVPKEVPCACAAQTPPRAPKGGAA